MNVFLLLSPQPLTPNHKPMTPKEKAKELYCKYADALNIRDLQTTANPFAKQCALIAVEEIINHHSQEQGLYRIDTYYWQQVKSELQSL